MNLTHALRLSLDSTAPDVVSFVGAGGKSSAIFRLAGEIAGAGHRVVTTTTTHIAAEQIGLSPAYLLVKDQQIDWDALEQMLKTHNQCLLISDDQLPKATGLAPHLVDALAQAAPGLYVAAILVEADGSARRAVKAPAPHEPVLADATNLLVPVLGLDTIGKPLDTTTAHRPELLRPLLGVADPATRFTPAMAARLLLDPQGGAKGRASAARFVPLINKADNPTCQLAGRLIARLLAEQGASSLLGKVGLQDETPVGERWGPTTAVVLAAGSASRMGRPKQLLELEGEALVVRAARLALASGATETLVVLGAYAKEVEVALSAVPATQFGAQVGRLRVIYNPDWQTGQASSVCAAVRDLQPACQAALFMPVDQPNVPVSLLRRLWRAWRAGHDRVATAVDGAMRGAPAIFDRSYFGELLMLEGDQGARSLLKGAAEDVATVPSTGFAVADVDTPDQWEQFLHFRSG